MKSLFTITAALALALAAGTVSAKLPAPSDEAKAKAAEASAKAAHAGKVAGYQLCKSQERVATEYFARAKASGVAAKPPVAMPACADPGPMVAAAPAKK